jgi:glucosamine--fructose-6-phosphate aminotransferase (isomerizing)
MLKDAQEAPNCIRQVLNKDGAAYAKLGQQLRELDPACVTTIARGSSDHAANYASYLIPLCTGKVVASLAPSITTVLRAKLKVKNQFTLAISQSGRSPDIINSVECVQSGGSLCAAIVNDVESPVAKMADALFPQHAGTESIAATKSVLCTMTSVAKLVAEWAQDLKLLAALMELPELIEQGLKIGLTLNQNILGDVGHVYVLSRGLGLSAAQETALKLKETCGLHAEAFSAAEVRHGPREIVGGNYLVLALALPDSGHDDVVAAAKELKSQGAKVMQIDSSVLPKMSDTRLAPLVALSILYPWLAESSRALGLDPDRPKTLKSKVIKTT